MGIPMGGCQKCSHESSGRVGRFSVAAAASQENNSRHGQLHQRDKRESVVRCLQRALRVLLLPPAVPVQSVWRRGKGHAPTVQSRQCEILAPGAASARAVRLLPDPEVLS